MEGVRMSGAAEDHTKQLAQANLMIAAGRQVLGGQIDVFCGLSLVGNEADADAIRVQLHAQLDVVLDGMAGLAKAIRAGASLS